MFRHDYPYTDFHELNLDWLLEKMKIFEEKYLDYYIKKGQLITPQIFGAIADDLTDDSAAFNSFYNFDGGFKYIPSGTYLIGNVLKQYEYGCLGNGDEITMPDYTYKDDFNSGEYAFYRDGNGPLYQNYVRVTDPKNFKPVNQVTFEQNYSGTFSYDEYNAGMVGFEVKGGVTGNNNSMPIGFRSVLYSENGGDGDVVGVWSRVYKTDPEDDVNPSDACAGHFSIFNDGTGTGLAMGTEIFIRNKRTQGTQGTNFSHYYNPGGAVGTHYSARSMDGMAQTYILCSQTGTNDKYGIWSIMSINNSSFKYDGNTAYPARTSVFKMSDFTQQACPNMVEYLGWCPYHVRMNGSYRYNVGADSMTVFNSTIDGEPSISVMRQANDGTTETGKTATLALGHVTYGGESHAPNVNGTRALAWRVYHEFGTTDIIYRAEAGDDGVARRNHAFYCYDGTTNKGSLTITPTDTFAPNNQNLGTTLHPFNLVIGRTLRTRTAESDFYGAKDANFSVLQCTNAFDVNAGQTRQFKSAHNGLIFVMTTTGLALYSIFSGAIRLVLGTAISDVQVTLNTSNLVVTITNNSTTTLFITSIVRNTEAYVEV